MKTSLFDFFKALIDAPKNFLDVIQSEITIFVQFALVITLMGSKIFIIKSNAEIFKFYSCAISFFGKHGASLCCGDYRGNLAL